MLTLVWLVAFRAKGRAKLEAAKGGKSQLGSRAQALKVKCPKCFTPMSDYVSTTTTKSQLSLTPPEHAWLTPPP